MRCTCTECHFHPVKQKPGSELQTRGNRAGFTQPILLQGRSLIYRYCDDLWAPQDRRGSSRNYRNKRGQNELHESDITANVEDLRWSQPLFHSFHSFPAGLIWSLQSARPACR